MKFSVLLPTRNRLNLLSYAVETVQRQNYADWEIVISDNCSDEDIESYARSLNEPRLKYIRTQAFLPVTDNWNLALENSSGDYIIMLGDDDCLMQGYFSTLAKIVNEYDFPDLVYTSAFLFAYPGVMPRYPAGFLTSYNERAIFRGAHAPFWLEGAASRELVRHSLDFRIRFDYNMQFSLVSRKLIDEMGKHGRFYQSPYPDYYASNAMMLCARRILIVPHPMVTIGISPKSFGFYYFNDAEATGNAFLQNLPSPEMAQRLAQIVLPGTDMNTSWLLSMETLANNFRDYEVESVNYVRYRFLQICAVYARVALDRSKSRSAINNLKEKMTLTERAIYGFPLSIAAALLSLAPKRYRESIVHRLMSLTGSHPRHRGGTIPGNFRTILDVFEQVSPSTNIESSSRGNSNLGYSEGN